MERPHDPLDPHTFPFFLRGWPQTWRRAVNALLSSCLDGELDPVEGLAKLSDPELNFLADALFKLLDVGKPEFGAKSWYDAVLEELAARSGSPARGDGATAREHTAVEPSSD